MRRLIVTTLLLGALAFAGPGCTYRTKGFYQGIYYEVPSADSSSISPTLRKSDERLYYKNVQTEMVIENNRLHVNGKDYGTLKAGDTVVISGGGDVSVNGQGRSPVGG